MALPHFDMRQLLSAGVHFGHQKHRWNPKMGRYIFGSRNKIHIIDLSQTVPLLHQAIVMVSDVVAKGGRVLFVGTKRQASEAVAKSARDCAQYYVNHRWLGGTLTNWKTISHSIKRLRYLEEFLSGEGQGLTKKERLMLTKDRDKLELSLGGIKDMGGVPDLLFVIDTNKESIAVAEAHKLNIPVIGVIDSNSDPDCVTIPIPGNDDAGRAITLYCDLIARAAIDGIERSQVGSGVDLGAQEDPKAEVIEADETALEAPKAVDAAEQQDTIEASETEKVDESAKKDTKKSSKPEKEIEELSLISDVSFEVLSEPKGTADDLKKISGIGPVLEKKLNSLGIYHYAQIKSLNKDDIAKIDDLLKFKGRIERDDWLTQAATLEKELVS
ncbi:MAG: 30S ribosomal protein S2 [Pseudomonadota bacterium]